MSKTHLFIDGSNLYGAQFELFGPRSFLDFSKFIKEVEKGLKINFDKIYFYASYSPHPKHPTKKENAYLKNENLFYKSVHKTKSIVFFKGYRSPTSGKEKEVDVKLAVDIVDFAHLNKFNSLYLLSGDADFMHALLVAERLNKKVKIISLENRVPFRFSFRYPTFVCQFSNVFKYKRIRGQKINCLKILEKLVRVLIK